MLPPKRIVIILASLLILLGSGAGHAQSGAPPDWRLAAALYPYQHRVDGDTDLTLTLSGNLPGRFSYFSFNNFKGLTTSDSARFDRSEQNLRMTIARDWPLDLNLQGVLADGSGNDFYQAGLSWRIDDTPAWRDFFDRINFVWRLTVHMKRWGVDSAAADAWGIEHSFRLTVPGWTDRLYLSGFYDKTYGLEVPAGVAQRPVVSEVQLGVRAWNDFFVVAEYRVNDLRIGDEHNLALGIEYQASW